jgi:hypothetical protein
MLAPRSRPSLLVPLVAVLGCKHHDDDDGTYGRLPDAQITWISDGDGPENTDPLEPATAGTAMWAGAAWQRWAGSVDAGSDDVLVKEAATADTPDMPAPFQGVSQYWETDDGLVVQALAGPLSEDALPILMVPEPVRVGMEWESDYGDGSVDRMAVTEHATRMLPTGPASVWSIAEYGEEGFPSAVRYYAEGIGRVGTSVNDGWDPAYGFDTSVVPASAQAHDEPGLAPAPLVGIVAIEPHGNAGHEVWGLSGAVHDGVLYGFMDGLDPAIGYSVAAPHDYCARLEGGTAAWVDIGEPGCPLATRTLEDHLEGGVHDVSGLAHAAMIVPGSDAFLEVDETGAVLDGGGFHFNDPIARWLEGDALIGLRTYLGSPLRDDMTADPWVTTSLTDAMPMREIYTADASFVGQRWIGPLEVEPGAPVHFAVVLRDGRVFRVTLDDDALSGFEPAGVLPGAMSELVTDHDRRAYSITTDGRVFALTLDPTSGDIAIDALGSVRVEEPGGGYEFKGVLVDPADGEVYVAAVATSLYSVPVYQTGIFHAHLDAAPTPLVSAASFGIGFADVADGLAVCWPPTDAPFDGTGWTLRGEPVEVAGPYGPDDACALIVFDRMAAVPEEWVGAERAVEANIPGVGPVRLGFPAQYRTAGLFLSDTHAVLRDGRVVDALGNELDADGLAVAFHPIPSDGASRDLGGYGLWTSGGAYDYVTTVSNIGGGIPIPECPVPGPWLTCYYAGPVVGGGMLYASPPPSTLLQVIRPDGRVDDLPTAQGHGPGILLADDRLCRFAGFPYTIACTDPAGVVESTEPLPYALHFVADQWWPLADGTLALLNTADYGPTMRFDPASMTVTAYDDRELTQLATSADGHDYAVAYETDGTSTIVELLPDGAVDIAEVPRYAVVTPVDGWFRVDQVGRIPR